MIGGHALFQRPIAEKIVLLMVFSTR